MLTSKKNQTLDHHHFFPHRRNQPKDLTSGWERWAGAERPTSFEVPSLEAPAPWGRASWRATRSSEVRPSTGSGRGPRSTSSQSRSCSRDERRGEDSVPPSNIFLNQILLNQWRLKLQIFKLELIILQVASIWICSVFSIIFWIYLAQVI